MDFLISVLGRRSLCDKGQLEVADDAPGQPHAAKKSLDFYSGGIEVTEKECQEYLDFVEKVLKKRRA